jgi:uncharacterized protein
MTMKLTTTTKIPVGLRVFRELRVHRAWLVLLLVAFPGGCSKQPELTYEEEIAAWHADKDEFLRESSESPVPKEQRAAFGPLTYFAINQEYRVPASLTGNRVEAILDMPTSTGLRRKMQRVGLLEFTLRGEALKLTAFAEAGQNDLRSLFVPFGDRTNGTETYPAGRYLDLERTATGIYDLDFNRAYHPFCLYNPTYDCPIPPRENRLGVPIRAGERLKP